jgi:hypothetical protein
MYYNWENTILIPKTWGIARMAEKKPEKTILDIDGVIIQIFGHEVKVSFIQSPNLDRWQLFMRLFDQLLEKGFKDFEFDLEQLISASSIDLGMWTTCNAKISRRQGRLSFVIGENAILEGILNLTMLNKIFTIKTADKKQTKSSPSPVSR